MTESLDLDTNSNPSLKMPFVAAGYCKTPKDAIRLFGISDLRRIDVGSYTLPTLSGNTGTTFLPGRTFALNAVGLTNPGLDGLLQMVPAYLEIELGFGKEIWISVAGYSVEEFVKLVLALIRAGVRKIQLNFGCPNSYAGNEQKPIFSFDPEAMAAVMRGIRAACMEFQIQISVKLSPYSNPVELQRAIFVLGINPFVVEIVCCNTFPNGWWMEAGKPVFSTPGGYAGISGEVMFPIALCNLRQANAGWKPYVTEVPKPRFIGCGGITNAERIHMMNLAGAGGTAICTPLHDRVGDDVAAHERRVFQSYAESIANFVS